MRYEAHITIEPCFGERLVFLKTLCDEHKFRVADLFLQKRQIDLPERSRFDSFATTRSETMPELVLRSNLMVRILQENGFKVYRLKLEETLHDVRYDHNGAPITSHVTQG